MKKILILLLSICLSYLNCSNSESPNNTALIALLTKGEDVSNPNPEIEVQVENNGTFGGQTLLFSAAPVSSSTTDWYTVKIINIGGSDLVIGTRQLTGSTSDFQWTSGTITSNPYTLSPMSEGTFQIGFNPSNTGTRNAVFEIFNSDADENPYMFYLTGNGT